MEEKKVLAKVKLSALKAIKDEPFERFEPDEWYPAEIEDIEINEGQYGPYIKWKIKVLGGETEQGNSAEGKSITRLMDATLSPSKILWKWLSKLLGEEPSIDEEYDITSYLGEKISVLIKDRKPKKNAQKGDIIYQEVDSVKRPKKGKKEKEEKEEKEQEKSSS
jgi:hypothetical protein